MAVQAGKVHLTGLPAWRMWVAVQVHS